MKARTLAGLVAVAAALAIAVALLSLRSTDVASSAVDALDVEGAVEAILPPAPEADSTDKQAATAQESGDNVTAGRQSFDCELSDFDSTGPLFSSLEELNEFHVSVASALSESQDAEHLLSSALFGIDGKFSVPTIREAVDRTPEDSRYRWHLLQACLSEHYEGDCDVRAIEREAIDMAGRSAHVWAAIATARERRGDLAGATEALRNAVGAPEYRNYFIEDVLMLERSLSVAADLDYTERMSHAFNAVVQVGSIGSDLYEVCQNRTQDTSELIAACIQLAERIESSRTTIRDASFAIIVQKLAYESLGNLDKLSQVEGRQQLLNDRLQSEAKDQSLIIQTNPHVLADYTAEFATKGEIAAMDFVEAETRRLLADPDYDPCTLIPLRAAPATQDR